MRFVSVLAVIFVTALGVVSLAAQDIIELPPVPRTAVRLPETLWVPGPPIAETVASAPKVNLVYLVPKDKAVSQKYVTAMESAGKSLIIWYGKQLFSRRTFQLPTPAVMVVSLPHDSSYYANNPRPAIFTQFWDNVLGDALPLTGGRFNDPNNVWAFYIDADVICNECGGCGTSGVLLVSANDLRGLAGETDKFFEACTPDTKPYPWPVNRWIGGLGHELGHAFGLPHPPGCDSGAATCDGSALMWAGYAAYPNTFLRADEKAVLEKSPYFLFQMPTDKKHLAR